MPMRFLRLEYAPTIVLILAVAQMASLADQGVFQMSYAVAGLFSFICLGSGVAVFLFLKDSMQLEPRSPAARTKVQDPARSRILKCPSEARNDGFVQTHNV